MKGVRKSRPKLREPNIKTIQARQKANKKIRKDEIIRSYVKKLSESGLLYSHKQIDILSEVLEKVMQG